MKLTNEQSRDYVKTLFEFVHIKMNKENQLMAVQFKNLFCKYTIDEMKVGFQDILAECELPNENLSGRLPKIGRVKYILDAHKKPSYDIAPTNDGKSGVCPPNIKKVVLWGLDQVGSGDFSRKEFNKRLIKAHGEDQIKMCRELLDVEEEYIDLGII